MNLQIRLKEGSAPIEVIERVIADLGAELVRVPFAQARKPRASKQEREFLPLLYKRRIFDKHAAAHLADAGEDVQEDETSHYIPCELDGVSTEKAIRKIENERRAAMMRDTRTAKDFPSAYNNPAWTTSAYVAHIEAAWSLVRTTGE